MDLIFRHGDPARPRGHALLVFREAADPDAVWATYVVVPPITMDLTRYVPPMFASQLPLDQPTGPAAYPLPPFPERAESLAALERLAAARGDDLLDGGSVDPRDLQRVLMQVTEIAQRYATRYADALASLPEAEPEPEPIELGADSVEDLLLSVMSDAEKVGRLAKLTGSLRYAVEGRDEPLIRETVAQMERLARHLPERYWTRELIAAAQRPGPEGGRLAELYVERCYKLAAEEYDALPTIEERIRALQA